MVSKGGMAVNNSIHCHTSFPHQLFLWLSLPDEQSRVAEEYPGAADAGVGDGEFGLPHRVAEARRWAGAV